jgi:hypothetical protein
MIALFLFACLVACSYICSAFVDLLSIAVLPRCSVNCYPVQLIRWDSLSTLVYHCISTLGFEFYASGHALTSINNIHATLLINFIKLIWIKKRKIAISTLDI